MHENSNYIVTKCRQCKHSRYHTTEWPRWVCVATAEIKYLKNPNTIPKWCTIYNKV